VFLAVLNCKEEDQFINIIRSFVNYTTTPDDSFTMKEIEVGYAKIQYLQTILHNFHDLPIRLQKRLTKDCEALTQEFCLLKTFLKFVDDYFIGRIISSGSPKFNDCCELADSISASTCSVNDTLYVQIVVTLTVFANILPPELFAVWEMRLLEALIMSRSHFLCGIIVDCWGCIAKNLNRTEVDKQVLFLINLVRIVSYRLFHIHRSTVDIAR
jgi:hypothetical protein